MTVSKEDYLKAIYKLSKMGNVSNKSISNLLGVKAASTSDMIKKITELGYTNIQGRKIILTELGKKEALLTIRKHRVWEIFLHSILKIDISKVHNEAENLEHATSELVLNKLEEYLFFPNSSHKEIIYLNECKINDKFLIIGFDKIENLSSYLEKKKINFKKIYEVIDIDKFSSDITIRSMDGEEITIAHKASIVLEVYKEEK